MVIYITNLIVIEYGHERKLTKYKLSTFLFEGV